MSRVYFHTEHRTAELRGSERAWLDHIARGPAEIAWNLDSIDTLERCEAILAMIPEVPDGEHGANYLHQYLREARAQRERNLAVYRTWKPGQPMNGPTDHDPERRLVDSLKTRLNGYGFTLQVAGEKLDGSSVVLNTALVAGSDVVAFAAKFHGSCESHAWIDGPDRGWLADIIDDGLRFGIYRAGLWFEPAPGGERKWSDQGWVDVTALLRETDDGPVVLSDSSGYRFPNAEYTDLDDEVWEDLPDGEQWALAMDRLRAEKPWARIGPDTLRQVTFGPGVTVYDLLAPDRDERVRAAFAEEEAEAAS